MMLVVGLTSTLVVACSPPESVKQAGAVETAEGSVPPSEPSTSPSPDLPADPIGRFRRARRALLRADTGAYTATTDLGPASIKHSGEYRLSTLSMNATVAIPSPEGTLKLEYLSVGETLWMRFLEGFPGVPEATCWLKFDVALLRELLGDLPAGAPAGLAPALGVLLTGRPSGGTVQKVQADADLYSVAATVSGSTPLRLGIPWETRARVPVTFSLDDDGDLVGWESGMAEVAAAMDRAGMRVPPDFNELRDGTVGQIETDFYRPGTPVDMEPPAARRVVVFTREQKDLQSAMFSCQKRSA